MLRIVLISIVVITMTKHSHGQGDDRQGQSCTRYYDNSEGLCIPSSQCPRVIRDYRVGGIKPQVCYFVADEPIICCPHRYIVKKPSNENIPQSLMNANRISSRKCNEYNQLFESGKYNVEPSCKDTTSFIVGGTPAKSGEFPHMAAIGLKFGKRSEFGCGGSLISERFVLTAAHCSYFNDKPVNIVRLGVSKLRSVEAQDYDIQNFIRHNNYSPRSHYNDIALIRLARNVEFGSFVKPACLWNSDEIQSKKSIATGWGKTEFASDSNSDDLLKVSVDIIGHVQCQNIYSGAYLNRLEEGIIDTQLCAGDVDSGGKDTCQGDSGAPLQIKTKSNKCSYHIIGVTSFGLVCGERNQPGIYTRISRYIDWIESVVWL